MRQASIVIIVAVLMLSACGKKSEEESAAVKAPPASAEQRAPLDAEQPKQAPEAQQETAQVPAVVESPVTAEIKKPVTPHEKAATNDDATGKPLSHDEGLALADKSGCLVCHKIEVKLVGPSWRDVSKRYKGDPDAKARLMAKVKAGGKGNWTEVTGGIAMPPYSPRVSDENIEKLVTFVLSQ